MFIKGRNETSMTDKNTGKFPYHQGELAAQDKAGTRGAASELAAGKRSALNFLANHDAFLAAQSFAAMSSVDLNTGNVWVTPLFAKAGDLRAVTENEIVISPHSIPDNDVLNTVESGTPFSLLGIDLNRRIRHRINGVALGFEDNRFEDSSFENNSFEDNDDRGNNDRGLHLQVNEYTPNCPKYINRREIILDASNAESINRKAKREERTSLTEDDQGFIQAMDTLWIGSYAPDIGADCNHRGGKPGFIRVTSPTTIEWPEYRGNGMFFTSGNLEVNDRAGVTLVDFETGSMIQMTGRALVDWKHDGRYEGASRAIVFHIERLVRTDNVTSHRWKRLDYSPYNPVVADSDGTGKDSTGNDSAINDTAINHSECPMKATLVKIVEETETVKTFRFVVSQRIAFLPGQYASFEFNNILGGAASEVRTWTLSETPNSLKGDNTLDISVKRVPNGLVTNWLHDHAELGLELVLTGIQGEMTAITLDADTQTPLVPEQLLLLSAGIGITPNLAMVRGIGAFSLQDKTKVTMIHVERYQRHLLSHHELVRRSHKYPDFSYTNIITSEQGRLTKAQLEALVPNPKEQQAYVCGPALFMAQMTEYLASIGVPVANIHTEAFDF
ncbi:Oxidoreductase FAD/NAD(P)-binding [Marinomonas sp. MED121]|uniref:FAD-binding oxidoreductase n=1 Tax=Marinomonas sp. MED121 TaxID=314277 RepID=UPI0000690A28|nr:pyridoxamine 5'-phosphate oxidase family protein [Marinomonas sp. MED121]EAQ64081.1 Oxidoreductase FAD/NAD(P)-binding [Marinomonas sp. MED121]